MFVSAGIGNKAAASAKVIAKDAGKGVSTIAAKVAQADVGASARRLANKVAERAEGGNFALVEELPEVESAMVNLKQTDQAYREVLAVLREAFVAQGRAVSRQLRVANRAEVIGRDIEGEAVSSSLPLLNNAPLNSWQLCRCQELCILDITPCSKHR